MKVTTFWDLTLCSPMEYTNILEVLTVSIIRAIALMIEAVRTYEMSVYFHETTRCYIPESCHLVVV
jgi:hypothetical protein